MTAAEERRPAIPVAGSSCRSGVRCKEVKRLLAAIEAAGGTVEPSRSRDGHWKVYLDGQYIGGIAGTPGDHRAMRNDVARLRRGGLNITSKGRYEG